ncbi:hypothetical protein LF887_10925 [Chryseobacterium sp. MEBOG06]|uniref:hypothetical protein n=1 Tax=Chryseobacterium sp. MEBOG06 TaxID=2879938 RepID=UPI001F1FA871|nr:hypothetical protein [Chryseobacterium sp. MEBOG06]UKB86108.1 hypothetical protein LF887_10925 [Chryseobacterium sp. MEBOG06]
MKPSNRHKLFLLNLLILCLILYNCKSTVREFYYDNRIEKTDHEKIAEELYFNNVPKEQQKTDKDVLLVFSGSAFKGKTIIINKKDRLSFDLNPDHTGCYGILFKKVPKSLKKINISVEGKENIIFPISDKYDYIYIGDVAKSKRGITYSHNFPSYFCM